MRIWDETLDRAKPVAISRHSIAGLLPPLAGHRGLASDLEDLFTRLKDVEDGTIMVVPDLATQHNAPLGRILPSLKRPSEDNKTTAQNLWHTFGKAVVVRQDGSYGTTLVSFRQSLPDDLAPALILDASGRVRTAYRLWEEQGTLVRLKEAAKHYSHLTAHLWNKGGGQSSFEKPEDWALRRDMIAATINAKPSSEPWLVITYKNIQDRLTFEIRGAVEGDPERIKFLHWGEHRATNEYRDIPNVILAGTLFLQSSAYDAIARAAGGLDPANHPNIAETIELVKTGEHRHFILQAACRGAVRKAENGSCAPSDLFIIGFKPSGITPELIAETFPGCRIKEWKPRHRKLSGKAGDVVEFYREWFAVHPGELLPYPTIMEAVGITRKNLNRMVRSHPIVEDAMAEDDICEEWEGGERVGLPLKHLMSLVRA